MLVKRYIKEIVPPSAKWSP